MYIGESGRSRRNIGTWGGLLVGAAALAGAVATTAAQAPPVQSERASGAFPADRLCEPGTSAARLADPEAHDPSALTSQEAAELDRQLNAAPIAQRTPDSGQPETIPVVFHVVSAEDGTGDIDNATIGEQIAVMNRGFGGDYGGVDTGFRFELAKVTRTANDAWFGDFGANEQAIKRELRQGDAGVLNLYSIDMGQGLLGRSTFPQDYESNSRSDGVVIDYRTVPGGGRDKFDLGHTGTHETGHWLGLFHTFQNGCEEPGDYVDDTPYEREQSSGCPEGRDTCTERPGEDPIHNFMNYSDDKCLFEFTEGQAERMAKSWAAFRT
ncbi:hypothetical protein HDA32_004538 [Spinactinospora alkalitolerans]|uniref:Peptidase M43 pregnancy-associated plasma-A domain-containing protein n=1 Tax=Spinactinospora alkalitolerans TaxID=687207 RepID=A0A852TZR9_9ACTN|nr:zinc metalloprotease [Spinactinospora alkalitolerans]NYE49418.1 hypothetical protein [Spinactinospora alkalitolerans]